MLRQYPPALLHRSALNHAGKGIAAGNSIETAGNLKGQLVNNAIFDSKKDLDSIATLALLFGMAIRILQSADAISLGNHHGKMR